MDRADLEHLDRDVLIDHAEALHVPRARILTRPERIDEILIARARADENPALYLARGFFGRARDLVARVVERGLHLPDAAGRIRAAELPVTKAQPPGAPVPTVTLAEMYAAQGHLPKALETVREVLRAEPDHSVARQLLSRYEAHLAGAPQGPEPPSIVAMRSPEAQSVVDLTTLGDAVPGLPPDLDQLGSGFYVVAPPPGSTVETTRFGSRPPSDTPAAPEAPTEAAAPGEAEPDACVAVPAGAGALFVYWQVSPASAAFWAKEWPGGRVTLRILSVEPTWDGPRRSHQDVDAGTLSGETMVRGLPRGAVLRVAVGVRVGEAFHAVAHSPALDVPPQTAWPVPATSLLRWTLEGPTPVTSADFDAPLIHRALERAAAVVE